MGRFYFFSLVGVMEVSFDSVFSKTKLDDDDEASILIALETIGVKEESDIVFVKAKDLISNGVRPVPARKFLHFAQNNTTTTATTNITTKEGNNTKETKPKKKKESAVSTLAIPTITRGRSRSRDRASTLSTPMHIGSIRKSAAFSKQFHPLSSFVVQLRGSLDDLKITPGVPRRSDRKLSKTTGNNDSPTCTLMEYEAVISDAESPLDVVLYLKDVSKQLKKKIGGVVCPGDNDMEPCGPNKWVIKVKWALPMDNFANPDAPDPDELAMWILDKLPPSDPDAMGSSKGIFVDVDLNLLEKMTDDLYNELKSV